MLSRTAWKVVYLKSLNTQTPGRSCMDSRPTFYIDAIREMEKGWVLLKPCRSEKGRSEQSLHHGPVSTACHLPWDYSRWHCLCTPTTVPPNNLIQFPKLKSSQVPGQKKKKKRASVKAHFKWTPSETSPTPFLLPERDGALRYFTGTREQQASQPSRSLSCKVADVLASESVWLLCIIFQTQENLSLEITLIPQSVQLISIITGIT